MDLSVELIQEPCLEFNEHFLHADKKTGISLFGPYGRLDPALHPERIRMGFVGTRETEQLARAWLSQCEKFIETDREAKRKLPASETDIEEEDDDGEASSMVLAKGLAPDFIGFNPTSNFACQFLTSDRWVSCFQDRQVKAILDDPGHVARVEQATDLISEHIATVATSTPHPDVILVALPDALVKAASSATLPSGRFLDLRRGLKARGMKWGVPIQLVKESTLRGKGPGLQDRATRAWNFCTAVYFKAGGIPWRGHGLEADTCYIGVTFYQAEATSGRQVLRSGVAQAFDYLGQGVVLRGEPFEWDDNELGRTPHLTTEAARDLISSTLKEYKKINSKPPARVVVHKSSRYWGASHAKFNEVEGFTSGVDSVNASAAVDLVSLQRSSVRLCRIGNYPPLRGTFVLIEGTYPVLYTHGYTPYFDTYPGVHVPDPWVILESHGDSDLRTLAAELLSLTKMNVNNAAFSDGVPITLAFSRRVSEILKQVGPEMTVRSEYAFYM